MDPQPHHSQARSPAHHAQAHRAQSHHAQPVTHNLLADGYISYTFTPKIAEFYLVRLLFKVANSALINAIPDPNGGGAYFVLDRPSFYTPPPLTINGQSAWVLDYDVRAGGSVVPQELWAPQGEGDRRRYVDQAQFRIPVFFVGINGSLGVPVLDAAEGHMQLRDTYLPPPLQDKTTVKIRIAWSGYHSFEQQVQLRDQAHGRKPIAFERFVKHVASRVRHFLAECERVPVQHKWRVGNGNITPDEVMLIGIIQISESSWMPILQLMRRVVIDGRNNQPNPRDNQNLQSAANVIPPEPNHIVQNDGTLGQFAENIHSLDIHSRMDAMVS